MEDTEAIVKQLQAVLEHDGHVDLQAESIRISGIDGGIVLEGEVSSVAVKKRAERAVGAMTGGYGVVDRLRVRQPEQTGDGALRDAVVKWLLTDVDFQNNGLRFRNNRGELETMREPMGDWTGDIEVSVSDGVVTLRGRVISLSHKRVAGALAWWARGCRDVANELQVEPGEADNDDEVTDAVRLVLETDPYVHADQIGVRTRDFSVTLDGVVTSAHEKRRAEMDAWSIHGVVNVVDRLEVRP